MCYYCGLHLGQSKAMQQWRSVFAQGPLKGAEQSFSVRAQACLLWFLALNIEALHSSCPSPALFFSPSSLFFPQHPLFPATSFHSFLKSLVIGASRFFSFFPSFSEFSLLKLPYNSPFGLSGFNPLLSNSSIYRYILPAALHKDLSHLRRAIQQQLAPS